MRFTLAAFASETALTIQGDTVIRSGKLFEIGDYPDKQFTLSEAEADAAVSSFSPAPLNVEHAPTIFDGKLGTIQRIWRKGKDVLAEYAIPKWLHDVTGAEPIKVSSEWDRDTKQVVGGALVLNPRVADAAIMAAFSAEFGGRGTIQRMHDMAADMGAECGGKSLFADAARFMTSDELKALQHVHDHTAKNGADCDAYMTRRSMYFSADGTGAGDSGGRGNPMTKWEKFTNGLKALFGDAGIEVDTEIPAGGDANAGGSGGSGGAQVATMSAEDKARFDALENRIKEQDQKLAEMAKTGNQAAAEARIKAAVKSFKLMPSKVEAMSKLAAENFTAFSAAMDVIEANGPAIQVGGYSGEAARAAAGFADESSELNKLAKEYQGTHKCSFAEAAQAVIREHPDLALAHFNNRPSVSTGGGEE